MSLDWNLSEIKDYENICFIQVSERGEEKRLNPVTECLIWATMAVDIGKITKENIDEFAYRLFFYERMFDPFIMDVKNRENKLYITYEQIQAHIGLSTNVSTLTRTKWMKHMTSAIEREYGWQANRQVEQQKKAIAEMVSV